MSTHYALVRDSLLGIVERLSQMKAEDGNKRLQELNEKLTQQQFNLVVMGQFKRGKSTFINALLGAEIVPTAIVPLTSIVTILRFGRETKAIVHYLNGHEEEVQLEVELKPFTTVEKLTSKSDFYFLLRDDPDATALIQLGIRFALPVFATKGIILKRMRAMAKEVFERHCGRVRYDLIKRTDETTRSFRKSLNEKTDLTLSAIRDALKRAVALKDQSEQEVSQTVSNLSARLCAVEEIRAELLGYRQQAESL